MLEFTELSYSLDIANNSAINSLFSPALFISSSAARLVLPKPKKLLLTSVEFIEYSFT
jgi:hypothetical protein